MSYQLHRGSSALLVSMPHVGTAIPPELQSHYQPRALAVEDTDWHLQRLYDSLDALGASVLVPRHSRYLIDLNRPPDDAPLYPGAAGTGLCPTRFFTDEPLYRPGHEPDAAERARRLAAYWQPYHQALAAELARIRARHGYALLWEAHSIRSQVPWLFPGRLPDLNFGSADGASADARIVAALAQVCQQQTQFSHVFNGRFKGGYITRHYGQPEQALHAIQLEMCQCLYMEERAPFGYDAALAATVQALLRPLLSAALNAARQCHET